MTISGAYYFTYGDGKNHIAVTESVKTIGGLVRYFDENDLVLPYTGWQKIGGKIYYFRSYESTPKAGLITDPVKALTYEGVRQEYQIKQPEDGENAKG